MGSIVLQQVTKQFSGKTAVKELDLEINDGEFLIVVGPSGCGKTTTLRMLAGFEKPSGGTIRMGGKVVNHVAPKDRNLAMVFQGYALFPHMTVAKNLSFGMKIRHEPRKEIDRQVQEVAGLLGIEPLLGRKPGALSGGERQRVALGRALLRKPDAFLLDEPLSNLDAALRAQMRLELKRVHAQFPITTVYVTHDQVEAMTMADRIAIMHDGHLQQLDTPDAIYSRPNNAFVAGFIGAPKINLVPAQRIHHGRDTAIGLLSIEAPPTAATADALGRAPSDELTVGLRPEDVRPAGRTGKPLPRIGGTVEVVEPLGAETHVAVLVGEQLLLCRFPGRSDVRVSEAIELEIETQHMQIFDRSTGLNLTSDAMKTAGERPASPVATGA